MILRTFQIGIVAFALIEGHVAVAFAREMARCKPLYPAFCKNVHIACAGRSSVPTSAFTLTLQGEMAFVKFDDGRTALAKYSGSNGARIFRLLRSHEWIRTEADGRFSQRIYQEGGALMAIGQCTTGPVSVRNN